MSEGDLSVLLGFHSDPTLQQYEGYCRDRGFAVDTANTPEAMLEKVAKREYDRYLMDLNLGKPNSGDPSPAVQVYGLIRQRVESGSAKFMGISFNLEAVAKAKQLGVPAKQKSSFDFRAFFTL